LVTGQEGGTGGMTTDSTTTNEGNGY